MLSFKKLLLVASLLLGEIAAGPVTAAERDVAGPEKRGLQKRTLYPGKNPNNILENEEVSSMTVIHNGGKATVTDLTGCTAVFFFLGTQLRTVAHILCGNEHLDAKKAAADTPSADSVTIGAITQARFNDAVAGIREAKPHITINPEHIYAVPHDKTKAATLHAQDGSHALVNGIGPKQTKQQPSMSLTQYFMKAIHSCF